MADIIEPEDRVVAFLKNLLVDETEGKRVENILLENIIEIAEQQGYYFTSDDFIRVVRLRIKYRSLLHKWPWPRP